MDPFLLGLLAASLSAVLWGTMFVPLKKLGKIDMLQFHAFMSLGIFLSTLVLLPLLGLDMTFNVWGIIAGLLWSAGNILSIYSIERIGLSKSPPIWMAIVMVMNFGWGVLFFREPLSSLTAGVLGVLMLIVGAAAISLATEDKKKVNVAGVALAAISGILYGSNGAIFKFFDMTAGEFTYSNGIGVLFSAIVIFGIKFRSVQTKLALPSLGAGTMWNVANISLLYAIGFIGLAISVPLSQLALLVSALWGLFYFKEIKGKAKRKVLMGAAILLLGGLLLAFAKI